jgi:undecaprenyl-diphosphatase
MDFNDERGKVFEITIQLAAILAVCWDYRGRLATLAAGVMRDATEQRLVFHLFIAFLPAAFLGVLFHHAIKAYLFNPLTVATALVLGGLAILVIEKRAYHPRVDAVERLDWRQALKIGFAQSLALFPGVSRAGATIMGGLVFGLSRRAATEFSFFLAIPTMFAATAYDLYKNWSSLAAGDLPLFAAGFVASFIAAMLAVKALLRWVAHHSFIPFAWYRIALGLVVLGFYRDQWAAFT